mgnify:CR=1 FL=1
MTEKNKYILMIMALTAALGFGACFRALQAARVVGLALSYFLVKEMAPATRKNKDVIWIGAFCAALMAYGCLTLLWSPDKMAGAKEICLYAVHFIILMEMIVFGMKVIEAGESSMNAIGKGWMIAIGGTAVIGIIEVTTGWHIPFENANLDNLEIHLEDDSLVHRRIVRGTFENMSQYDVLMVMAIPFIIWIMLWGKRLWLKVTAGALLVACYAFMRFNATRGGLIVSMVMALAIVTIYWMKYGWKGALATIGAIAIIGTTSWVYEKKIDTDTGRVVAMRTDTKRIVDGSTRTVIAEEMVNEEKKETKRWVTGQGVGSMQEVSPHNLFLEFLYCFGGVWFALLMAGVIKYALNIFKVKEKEKMVLMIATAVTLPVCYIMDSTYLLSPMFYVSLGALYLMIYENTRSEQPVAE